MRVFSLAQVVPWGRSYDEYRQMFALTDTDLHRRMIGCADGPAAFNAGATRRGFQVVSCDPIYRLRASAIRDRIAKTFHQVIDQAKRNVEEFVWDVIPSVDVLGQLRMKSMEEFLADYESGKRQERYIDAELPRLPFPAEAFDLALCSHFLFLYSDQLDESFHRKAIQELCRVAHEVRIFPLLALSGQRSKHVDVIVNMSRELGYDVSLVKVPYEFQRGGNQMMLIRRP